MNCASLSWEGLSVSHTVLLSMQNVPNQSLVSFHDDYDSVIVGSKPLTRFSNEVNACINSQLVPLTYECNQAESIFRFFMLY